MSVLWKVTTDVVENSSGGGDGKGSVRGVASYLCSSGRHSLLSCSNMSGASVTLVTLYYTSPPFMAAYRKASSSKRAISCELFSSDLPITLKDYPSYSKFQRIGSLKNTTYSFRKRPGKRRRVLLRGSESDMRFNFQSGGNAPPSRERYDHDYTKSRLHPDPGVGNQSPHSSLSCASVSRCSGGSRQEGRRRSARKPPMPSKPSGMIKFRLSILRGAISMTPPWLQESIV